MKNEDMQTPGEVEHDQSPCSDAFPCPLQLDNVAVDTKHGMDNAGESTVSPVPNETSVNSPNNANTVSDHDVPDNSLDAMEEEYESIASAEEEDVRLKKNNSSDSLISSNVEDVVVEKSEPKSEESLEKLDNVETDEFFESKDLDLESKHDKLYRKCNENPETTAIPSARDDPNCDKHILLRMESTQDVLSKESCIREIVSQDLANQAFKKKRGRSKSLTCKDIIRNTIRNAVMTPEILQEALHRNDLDMSSMLLTNNLLILYHTEQMTEVEIKKREAKKARAMKNGEMEDYSDICLAQALQTQDDLDHILYLHGAMPFTYSPPPQGFKVVTNNTETHSETQYKDANMKQLMSPNYMSMHPDVYDFDGMDGDSLESSLNSFLSSPQKPGSCGSSLNGTIERLQRHLSSNNDTPEKSGSTGHPPSECSFTSMKNTPLPMTSPVFNDHNNSDQLLSPNNSLNSKHFLGFMEKSSNHRMPMHSTPQKQYSMESGTTEVPSTPRTPQQLISDLVNLRQMLEQAEDILKQELSHVSKFNTDFSSTESKQHVLNSTVEEVPVCQCVGANGMYKSIYNLLHSVMDLNIIDLFLYCHFYYCMYINFIMEYSLLKF